MMPWLTCANESAHRRPERGRRTSAALAVLLAALAPAWALAAQEPPTPELRARGAAS